MNDKELNPTNRAILDFCPYALKVDDKITCTEGGDCMASCTIRYEIGRMIARGYRRADEVRKETAKEILYFLKVYITDGLLKNHEILNALIKHYGVEVE